MSCARCCELEAEVERLTRELAKASGQAPGDLLAPHVHEIGAYWREKCNHPRAKIDGRRFRAVRARLIEGIRASEAETREAKIAEAVAEIKEAIDGAAAAPNVNEHTGERYDDLELICRNQSKLDSFRARAPKRDEEEAIKAIKRKLIGG